MKYSDLKRIEEAPEKGYVLAYTRKKIIFEEYLDKKSVETNLSNIELLEIHLFDNDKEYRAIVSESPRFNDGVIETAVPGQDDSWEDEDIFKEETVVDFGDSKQSLTVINHIRYDENGMVNIDNYRLVMGGV